MAQEMMQVASELAAEVSEFYKSISKDIFDAINGATKELVESATLDAMTESKRQEWKSIDGGITTTMLGRIAR